MAKKRKIRKAHKPDKPDPKKVKHTIRKVAVLDWMRAKTDDTICAKRRTWNSRCGLYKVVESIGKFSEMGTIYYAIRRAPCEQIVSTHRKRAPAEKACEKDTKTSRR